MRNTESIHPARRPDMGAASPRQKMEDDARFKADLLDLIPFLRAFARSLCGNQETADDLAQETLVKAWQARDMFAPGTNLKAWLFTILRNQFYSDRRRAWRQAPWDQEAAERIPGSVLLPLSSFDLSELPDPGGRMVVFSCRSGNRSVTASRIAQASGLPYDAHLAGGIKAWKEAGLPTET